MLDDMEKLVKKEKIDYDLDWKYTQVSLSEIKEDLDALEKLGATHIEFDTNDYELSIKPIKQREESDEEFSKRLKFIKEREEVIKKQELQQLETLRKKYNV